VVTLEVPPLREQDDDMILLAETLLQGFGRRYGKPQLRLGDAARAAMRRHAWPGNVRELRNAMEQAALLSPGDEVAMEDLALARTAFGQAPGRQEQAERAPSIPEAGDTLTQAERSLIVKALQASRGNVSQAAKDLGISRDKLRYRMDKYGLRDTAD
jgi:DNA-binding NtrC family response regulator